ncbi:DNA glycosylase/AP lyase ROS1-like [Silene latifolia]|uniref:DNA glycosylase/AP lyase ROS1-like n=1 Tax=Silene latifolia TaxID=37657 RepID=UPI003D77B65D
METQRGRSVSVANEFHTQGSWTPETPVKPNIPRPSPSISPSPIYDDGQGGLLAQAWGEREAYLSRVTQQNVLSYSESRNYPTTSNTIWGNPLELERANGEIQRQDLEEYLPHWSSQGRRSVMTYGSSDHASVSYPIYSSWNSNGARENGTILDQNFRDPDFNTMSFRDLLSINESLTLQNNNGDNTSAGMFFPGWVSQSEGSRTNNDPFLNNQEALHGINMQGNGFYDLGMKNGLFCSNGDPNSLPSNKHANGSSAFAPATPDTWQRLQSITPSGINQGQNEQNVLQGHDVGATMVNIQDHHDENVPGPITESLPGKVTVTEDADKGGNETIDLNNTPQKKPRRRRYQPKVIRENKPKRTPKFKTPNSKATESQVKRKYVRKNKTNTPTIPPTEATEPNPDPETEPKTTESTTKSCRRSLNFDLNGQVGEASECQETENQSNHHVHSKPSMTAYDLNLNENQELREYMLLPVEDNIDNSQTDVNIFLRERVESPGNLYGKIAESSIRKDSYSAQSPNSSPCASSSEAVQTRGLKRTLSFTTEPTLIDVQIATFSNTGTLHRNSNPDISKRKRAEKTEWSDVQSTLSPVAVSEVISQVGKDHSHPHVELTMSLPVAVTEDISQVGKDHSHPQVELTMSKYYCCNSTRVGISGVANNHTALMGRSKNRDQLMKTWADLSRLKQKMKPKGATHVRDPAKRSEIASAAKGPHGELAADINVTQKTKRRSKKQDSVNKNWSIVPYDNNCPTRQPTGTSRALSRRKKNCSIERLTQLFQQLDINRQKSKISRKGLKKSIVPYQKDKQQSNALVLYEKDGSIVPFEGPFNPINKRRQRARVDLDDETTRVWRLLLENIDNEGINGTDEDKAKWWENERRVFRGRVDSFIARMRLVQGDRRFTPWKGSVLDSVIGVFLTQNVSDHLSSSAFMSMAARFPLKPESPGSTLSEESTSAFFVEPEIRILEPEESITWNEKIMEQPNVQKNSGTIFHFDHSEESCSEACRKASTYSRGYVTNNQNTEIDTVYLVGEDKARDDVTSSQQSVISSQNSISSPHQQTVGIMNTFPEGNSRTQAVTSSSKFDCLDHTASFMGLLKMAEGNIQSQSNGQTQAQRNYQAGFQLQYAKGLDTLEVESRSSDMSRKDENSPTEQSNLTSEITDQEKSPDSFPRVAQNMASCYILEGETMVVQSQMQGAKQPLDAVASSAWAEISPSCRDINIPLSSQDMADVIESTREFERTRSNREEVKQTLDNKYAPCVVSDTANTNPNKTGKGKAGKGKKSEFDWDSLRRAAQVNGKKPKTANTMDSLDWEAVRHANVNDIADTIKERGMNNVLAVRIKDLLDRLVKDHGSIDMEWLRDIPPDKAKEYLLSFRGLGLKSVECVRLLTLHHLAFPVDTNVGRIAVRLGWVPLQPLPESLQLHLLEMYPILESIQQYLWPRLCKLDQKTLYELHYHMITFGKVFCTKRQPNCNACPLRGECRHFASAFASARFSLPGPEEKSIMPATGNTTPYVNVRAGTNLLPSNASWGNHDPPSNYESYGTAIVQGPSYPMSATVQSSSYPLSLPSQQTVHLERKSINSKCEPIVEVPASPEQEPQHEQALCDIEDTFYEDPNEIPTINLNMKEFTETLQNFMLQEAGMSSNALVALTAEAASIPTPKLKNINRLRTEHHVYELPDTHPLLHGLEKREPDDPCSYLLAIWTPGETANSIDPPARRCCFDDPNILCNEETCSYCSSQRETDSQTVRGTLLIPTRTAMRGSFPLNGTYFQVNEVFADHDSSLNPIAVPRSWLWNLPRRTVYFGTSIPTIFKGLNTEDIQHCFWRGYVCVRGFDQKTRAPRPLMARLHFPASRIVRGAKSKAYDE